MNDQNDKESIEALLTDYARVLNSAAVEHIASFYTKDGQFMPDGMKTIAQPGLLKKSGENHLAKKMFSIEYTLLTISVDSSYAFVEAIAKTGSLESKTGKRIHTSSRDFFVLRKEDSDWKIHRYLFNNVEEIK